MADKNKFDTSKTVKNPLLTAAGVGFPIENFTSNALLLPVSQNVSNILPTDVEEDSFLGQNPAPSSYGSLLYKPPPILGTSQLLSQPTQNPTLPLQPEQTKNLTFYNPNTFSQSSLVLSPPVLSSSQLDDSTSVPQNPVPVFTQNFSVHATPLTKPTPIYPHDSLSQRFHGLNLQKAPEPRQTPSPGSATETISLRSSPGIPTPTLYTPHGDSSTLSTPSLYSKTDFSAPILYSPVTTPSLFTPPIDSALPTSTLYSNTDIPSSLHSTISTSSLYTPPKDSPLPTSTLFTKTDVSASLLYSPPLFTPVKDSSPVSTLFSPQKVPPKTPPQSLFSPHIDTPVTPALFSVSNSNQTFKPSATLFNPSQSPLPASTGNVSVPPTSLLSNISLNKIPLTSTAPPLINASVLSTATPPTGTATNSYRLSNLKRPLYTRPPDLAVTTPVMANIDTMPPPVLPQQSSAMFTPEQPILQDENYEIPSPASAPATLPLGYIQSPMEAQTVLPPSFASLAQGVTYRPVYHHWFYRKEIEGKTLWHPFSMPDSLALEGEFTSPNISPDTKVPTDGGRYDVEVLRRRRIAVYWEEEPREVRRCSWFVKGSIDARYVPYEESIATMLEDEYRQASSTNEWNKHVNLPDGEVIIFHSPNAIAHHSRSSSPDAWGNTPQMQHKPRIVKRGMDEFDISEGEPDKVDHLLFLVHGIGKFCDLKFRPVAEVGKLLLPAFQGVFPTKISVIKMYPLFKAGVDDFRSICLQLIQSHFKGAVEAGTASRVEVLPVPWHQALHNEDINTKLYNITLQSIPRLRQFTNDTLSDILFYTSPVFCEKITQTVGNEMNRLYALYRARNPDFQGNVSVGGHSLGSVILFDMLCNQKPVPSPTSEPELSSLSPSEDITLDEEIKEGLGCFKTKKARLSRGVSYVTIGRAGTGQPYIAYPQLMFSPTSFFALGSPIGMFLTVRGIDLLGEDFQLPTCPSFFNIFHPFDPVAYRIESLINPDLSKYPPLQIPHHKGRKRMHLELKDTLEHVGTALKQKLMDSMRSTWNTVYQLAMFHKTDDRSLEQEVNKVIEDQIITPLTENSQRSVEPELDSEVVIGCLNGGRRVDYVLQEAPLESFNEYIFALTSHACYWESEDTLLMMLKEIYSFDGVMPDNQVLHQIMPFETVERDQTDTRPSYNTPPVAPQYVPLSNSPPTYGMDPTAPVSENVNVGPPPMTGFVRK